jgi:hypothetical protein
MPAVILFPVQAVPRERNPRFSYHSVQTGVNQVHFAAGKNHTCGDSVCGGRSHFVFSLLISFSRRPCLQETLATHRSYGSLFNHLSFIPQLPSISAITQWDLHSCISTLFRTIGAGVIYITLLLTAGVVPKIATGRALDWLNLFM